MLPVVGTIICITAQTVPRVLTAIVREACVRSVARLMALCLWFDNALGALKWLVSGADGYALCEQCPPLEASMRLMHVGPGLDSAAWLRTSTGDEDFYFSSTYFSPIYTSSCFMLLCKGQTLMTETLWDVQCRKRGPLLVFGSLLDCVEEIQGLECSLLYPVVKQLDETGMPVSSGLLPLQNSVKIPTVMPSFEEHLVLFVKVVQETRTVTGETIRLAGKQEVHDKSVGSKHGNQALSARDSLITIKRCAASSPLSPTVPNGEYIINTAAPENMKS